MSNSCYGTAQDVAMFDSASPFRCGRNSFVALGSEVFGSGNTSSAFRIDIGGQIQYNVLPTLDASGTDVDISGNPTLYATLGAVGVWITLQNAGMIIAT